MPVDVGGSGTSQSSSSYVSLFLQVGWKSFEDLSNVFAKSLLASAVPRGDRDLEDDEINIICSSPHEGQTYFHLNPYDTDGSVWTMKLEQQHGQDRPVSCAGTDWVIVLILVCIIHTVSWVPRWTVWEPLADFVQKSRRRTTSSTTTATIDATTAPTWNEEECKRFSMTVTSCMFFVISAIFGFNVLAHKPWLFDRQSWMDRSPLIEADFKFYYLLYAARFISDSVSLFFESRNRDAFIASIIHHIVTLGLVLGSAATGFSRYGGIIMFFFDWADIPLLAAKACKYLSLSPKDPFQLVANRLFEVFAVTFFATRNVWYTYIVYSAWIDLAGDPHSRHCRYLLLLLAGLQTYWLGLIIQAVIRQKNNGGTIEDSRDDGIRDDKKKTN